MSKSFLVLFFRKEHPSLLNSLISLDFFSDRHLGQLFVLIEFIDCGAALRGLSNPGYRSAQCASSFIALSRSWNPLDRRGAGAARALLHRSIDGKRHRG